MKAALRGLKIAVVAVLLNVALLSGAHAQTVSGGSCSTSSKCGADTFTDIFKNLEGGAAASNASCKRNGCSGCSGGQFCTYDLGDGGTTMCYGHYTKGGGDLCSCTSAATCESIVKADASKYWNKALLQAKSSCCQDSCFVQELAQLNVNMGDASKNALFKSAWPAIQNFCSNPDAAVAAIKSTKYYNPTGKNAKYQSAWRGRADRLIAVIQAGCGHCPATPAPPSGGGGPPTPPPPGGPKLPVVSDSCGTCSCTRTQARATIQYIVQQHEKTRAFITEQFKIHEDWIFGSNRNFGGAYDSFFELHMLPALMMMTEQLATTGMEQMFILGSFFDAKLELETQRLFQEKAAEAHKDYQPATGMCVIGTTVRGLASADRNGEFTSYVLSQRSQDRQLGIYNLSAAFSSEMDREGRIRQVKERYCDRKDNGGDMDELCETGKTQQVANPAKRGGVLGFLDPFTGANQVTAAQPNDTKPESVNKDIDYTRTVDLPRTLNIDFTDGKITGDEQDVLALQSNLFADTVLDKLRKGPGGLEAAEGSYMEMRGVIAKRSIAENSYNSIIGLKTAGTEASEKTILFTEKMLEQFGIKDENERRLLLGGTKDDGKTAALRPSYYAQMEALAQKIYQDPRFYTNLYDTPANVMRKKVAMQAIGLMLKRDMYKSEERSEMVMSVWLEMELMQYQNDIQNQLNAMTEEYEQN